MKDNNNFLRKFDIILTSAIFIMLVAVIIEKKFFPNTSLALFNLSVSLITSLYLIIGSKKLFINKKFFLVFLIAIVRIITSLLSFNELNGEITVIQICYDISLIVNLGSIYLILINIIPNKTFTFKYINYGLIIICLIYSVYNLINGINNFVYFSNIKYRYLINFSSFFSNKNLFGQLLLFGLFSTHFELENRKSKFLLISKYFLIFNLILTLSRTAILAFLIFKIITLISDKKIFKIFIPMVSFLTIFMLNLFGIRDFIFTFVIRSDAMTSGRTEIWKICLDYFYKSPLIGYGELHISNIIDNITGVTSMHSWFLKLLLNGGIVNFICYITILLGIFLKLLNLIKNNKNDKILKVCLAFFVSLISYGFFEEINLFEFGWSSLCFTYFIVILPILMCNKMEGIVK